MFFNRLSQMHIGKDTSTQISYRYIQATLFGLRYSYFCLREGDVIMAVAVVQA